MRLFVSKRRGEPLLNKVSPSMRKVAAYLDRSKDGELFTTVQLMLAVGYSKDTLSCYAYMVPGYWHNIRTNLKYWGKPATIDELRKELKKR